MKTRIRIAAFCIVFLTICQNASTQILPQFGKQRAGLSTLSFLKNDINPSSLGRSGASVALSGNGFSALTNPAALTHLTNTTLALTHMILGAGIQQSYASAQFKLESMATWGVTINSLNSGAMQVRTEFQPDGTGQYFYVSQNALGLNYAQKLTDMFSLGVQLKIIGENMASYSNYTAAVDLGFLYETDLKNLKFAVVIQNFGGSSSLEGEEIVVDYNRNANIELSRYTLPTVFKMGLSIDAYKKGKNRLNFSTELNHPNDNSENLRFGFEYSYATLLKVQLGYKLGVKGQSYPTFGFGYLTTLGVHQMSINYALNPTNYIGTQHNFGIIFSLNKSKRE